MPRVPEKKIVSDIKKLLHSFDNCFVRKRRPYVKGDPDLTGCYNGIRIEIEVKAPDGHPTRLQEKRVEDWKKLGCIAGIAWSVEDVVSLMYEHLTDADILKIYKTRLLGGLKSLPDFDETYKFSLENDTE